MHPRIQTALRSIDAAPRWQSALLVFLLMWALFATTARYEPPVNNDILAAAVAASHLAAEGNLTLDRYEGVPWTIEAQGRTVSGRFPGVIFIGVPFYWLTGTGDQDDARHPLGPAALTAATAAAGAVALLFLCFSELSRNSTAILGASLAGLGTSMWSVSAHELWTHGPQQLWLALAMLLLARERLLGSGLAFGGALLTRPPTAVAAAVVGGYKGWRERRPSPILLVGIGAGVGLVALMAYNQHVFGTWSPTGAYGRYESLGGYGDTFLDNVLHMPVHAHLWNIGGTLFSPARGVLWTSPFLLLLIPGIPGAWKRAPTWVKAVALGGIVELLVQLRADTYTGGEGFFSYRTPIGPLTMMAPLLLLAYVAWTAETPWRRWIFAVLAAVSVLVHGTAAVLDIRY